MFLCETVDVIARPIALCRTQPWQTDIDGQAL